MLVLKEFRKHNPDVTANQMLTFLNIASGKATSQVQLTDELGMSDGSVSRLCAVLSKRGNRGVPGQDLIEVDTASSEYRVMRLRPSPKGRMVVDTLRHIMKKGHL